MTNKHLKIENLENLQVLTTEEFSTIQGGLTIAGEDGRIANPELFPQPYPIAEYPLPRPQPYPLPRPYPLPQPYPYPCSPYPGGKLPWCAVIL